MAIDFRPDVVADPRLQNVAAQEPSLGVVPPAVQAARDTNARVLLASESPEDRSFGPTPNANMRRRASATSPMRFDFRPDEPLAPVAAQADVRKTEPAEPAMERQTRLERAFDESMKRWRNETGGVLKPGQDVRQAVSEWAGVPDPAASQEQAELEHLREGGRPEYGTSVAYNAAKGLAAIVGASLAGPAGATGAEAVVRQMALANQLERAVASGVLTEDEAADMLSDELVRGAGIDAAFNFGVPALMLVLGKIPGLRNLGHKVAAKLSTMAKSAVKGQPVDPLDVQAARNLLARETPEAQQLERVVRERQQLAPTDPAARSAIAELSERTGGRVPSPGQVTGEVGGGEAAARLASRNAFRENEKRLAEAAEGLIEETVRPGAYPGREQLGRNIVGTIDAYEKAAKSRLGQVFKEVDEAGIGIDVKPMVAQIDEALTRGFALTPAERAELIAMRDMIMPPAAAGVKVPHAAWLAPQELQDLLSSLKGKLRSLNPDGKPSPLFGKLVGDITRAGDGAMDAKLRAAGKPALATAYDAAKKEYRALMDDIYGDAGGIRKALKATPEDVGGVFWAKGTVGEVKQLRRTLDKAVAEKVLTQGEANRQMSDVTVGFLQENASTLGKAAGWRDLLRTNPKLNDSWKALTDGPGGAELRSAMETLAAASEIAARSGKTLGYDIGIGAIPISRAAQAGLGVSYVTGTVNPGMVLTGLGLTGIMRAMATAYTHGNTGLVRDVARLLRANQAGTAVGAKVMQDIVPRLAKFAEENGITDIFVEAPNGSQ